MSLMDLYKKTYGGADKTAAAGKPGEDILSELLGEKAASEATTEETKTAAAYEELGRQLARESFATDVLGLDPESEKTAAVIAELLSGPEKTAEKTEEKVADKKETKEAAADAGDALLIELGLAEAPKKEAEDKAAAEKKEAELKQGALNELAVRMAKNAKKGDEKSKAGLMMLKKKAAEGNVASRQALSAAVNSLKSKETASAEAGKGREPGQLEGYLAAKKKAS
jgi:colicin import membrane protein